MTLVQTYKWAKRCEACLAAVRSGMVTRAEYAVMKGWSKHKLYRELSIYQRMQED